MRNHLTRVRMAIINKSTKKQVLVRIWGKRNPFFTVGGNADCCSHCGDMAAVWRYLKKIKMDLPFDPAIPLLGIYPKEPKAPIQNNIRIAMFIAVLYNHYKALFTITQIWKQPKCPSVDEWIKQLWGMYRME